MKRWIPTFAALVFAAATLLAGGCKGHKVEQISRIVADPTAFARKDVTVAGRVTEVFDPTRGLLGISAYRVDDGSGRIWVISRNGTPSKGQEVGLKGRVRTDFQLGSELFGAVLNEVERKTR